MRDFTKKLIDPTFKTVSSSRWAYVRGNQMTWALIGSFVVNSLFFTYWGMRKGSSLTEIGSGIEGIGIAYATIIGAFQAFIQGGKVISSFGEAKKIQANPNYYDYTKETPVQEIKPGKNPRSDKIGSSPLKLSDGPADAD